MCLSELMPGELGKIIDIKGGWALRHKLSLRGIVEGSSVRMISSNRGPIVVEVERNVVALGRGMAQRIVVKKGLF